MQRLLNGVERGYSCHSTLVRGTPSLPFLTRVREERHGGAEEKQAMESI